jgi:hypothetical protein
MGSEPDIRNFIRDCTYLISVLAPLALPRGYSNFLTQETHEQIASAYANKTRRLRDFKQ